MQNSETGQRRRTRKAIIAAAAELLKQGRKPSVQDVAEAADVSRRTLYMYFPTLDQLLLDAALERTRSQVEPAFEPLASVEERVDGLVRAIQRNVGDYEREGRMLMSLTAQEAGDTTPRRGYRRVEWIEAALAPLRGQVDDQAFQRLVSGLAMVMGWEALVVLKDTRGLGTDDQVEVCAWAAQALLQATVRDDFVPKTKGLEEHT